MHATPACTCRTSATPTSDPNPHRWGTAEQAAAEHGVSIRTIRRLIARGDVTTAKVGRLVRVDLDTIAA